MSQLTKLIQQYERENPGTKAKLDLGYGHYRWYDQFVLWQANEIEKLASRPTCGKEQRKFLDEIEKGSLHKSDYDSEIQKIYPNWKKIDVGEHTEIWSEDFESDLQKVINGE